jgi:hypothetical protein
MRTSKETLDIVALYLTSKGAAVEKSSAGYSYSVSINGKTDTVSAQEVDHLAIYSSSNLESYADSVINDLNKTDVIENNYDGTIESEFE